MHVELSVPEVAELFCELACEFARVDFEEVIFEHVADAQVGDGIHCRDAGTGDDSIDQTLARCQRLQVSFFAGRFPELHLIRKALA